MKTFVYEKKNWKQWINNDKMQEEQKKLLDAGIKLKDDFLDLEMQDLADVINTLALSTRKRLKKFVDLSREV